MIKSNILTLEIRDRQTESKIKIELTNETMHKLYRIKEIHDYKSLFEYDPYARLCDDIKAKVNEFIYTIEQEYLDAFVELENGNLKNEQSDAIQELDKLILAGYDYNKAYDIVSEKYLK